jgi:TolB-like protein/DNA-binding winged helix-turn-helix (wHTH) protein/Tfp pilus assembly protein PilF
MSPTLQQIGGDKLQKPFVLVQTMESPVLTPQVYRFATFVLDVRTGELTHGGTRVPLREQSLQLLLALLEQPGQLVTREELMGRLWPPGTFVDADRGLNKAVKHLREALGDSADQPRFIETFPRRGYRLLAPVTRDDQPDQLERAVPASTPGPSKGPSRFALLMAAVVVLALAIAVGIGIRNWRATRSQALPQISSLAVIPLENLSHDPDQEYFADGMTDELITNLAKVSQARIVSRTSVMHYKGSRKTLREIAQELNVDAVVEGTVQRSGNRVRITAQLIQASTDSHLWAESYEQDLSGILDLQRNVATDIARKVNIIVRPLRSTRPVDPAAYVAYLKGRYEFYRYTKEGWQRSIEYFNQAIQGDPGFAPAHAGLAASYLAGVGWEALPPEELPKGKAAAEKALELDDQLPSAHFVMGVAHTGAWRWQDAETEFQRGLQLDPNDALGRQWYSNYLVTMGRFQEAIHEQELARTADPFSPTINANLAKAYYYARQFDRAVAQAQETLKLDPKYHAAFMFLERAYRHQGMADMAVNVRLAAASPEEARVIKLAYQKSGLAGVLRAEAEGYQRTGAIFEAARCYVQAGDKNVAFTLLEDYYKRHYPGLARLKVDPDFDPVRSDPRFQALLSRVGLPL